MDRPLLVRVMMTQSSCGTCKQENYFTLSQGILREFTVWLLALMGMSWPVAAMIARSSCGTCKQENYFTPSPDIQPPFAVWLLVLMDRYSLAGVAMFALSKTQKLSYGTSKEEGYSAP